jgi:hypothetical protein
VARFCEDVLRDLINALGLHEELYIATEMGVWNVRPDMWVIKRQNGLPIGAVEVR